MTRDHAAAQMPGWMLRDHANLADAYKQHIHDGGESALGDFLRDEAARREAEERAANRRGEGSDTERTAADDALLFKGVDAPPPPAPDDLVKRLRELDSEAEGISSVALRAADAIETLRAERDALLSDWNAMVLAIGASKHGTAIAHAAALKARAEAAEARIKEHEGDMGTMRETVRIWRDTAKDAEAREKRLRDASKKAVGVLARAFDRIHCLPRTSDTELANDISATMTALAQGSNDG